MLLWFFLAAGIPSSTLSRLLVLLVLVLVQYDSTPGVDATGTQIPCTNDETCEMEVGVKGSICLENGECSNPYASGCLHSLYPDKYSKRICNSNDPIDAAEKGVCVASEFSYTEIRVGGGNWDTGLMNAWILQILLSELVQVPSTIESRSNETQYVGSFYDPYTSFPYSSKGYDYEAFRKGHEVVDCTTTKEPCLHVMPEVAPGQVNQWTTLQREGYLKSIVVNGMIGFARTFVTQHTAKQYPFVMDYRTMAGEEKRPLLASIFKRPTTWEDYCNIKDDDDTTDDNINSANVNATTSNTLEIKQQTTITTSTHSYKKCTPEDPIAQRKPQTDKEKASYHVKGVYKGHFRYTEENNCKQFPHNCTGHITEFPCSWSAYRVQTMYWNDIALTASGSEDANGGYSYGALAQILDAAIETNSSLLYPMWNTDVLYLKVLEHLQPINLPEPTEECGKFRPTYEERCSSDFETRMGNPLGACGDPPGILVKLITASLQDRIHKSDEASRSPAYDLLSNFQISDLAINLMLSTAVHNENRTWGYSTRQAVCHWIAENIETLELSIPEGYPRQIQKVNLRKSALSNISLSFGILSCLLTLLASIFTYVHRQKKVMIYAQVNFLFIVLLGLFFVSVASIIYSIEVSHASCILQQWLVLLGYSIELVPLVVKVAAINKLFQNAKKMKRVKLTVKELMTVVSISVAIVIVMLIIWTVLDPPKRLELLILTDTTTNTSSSSTTTTGNGQHQHQIVLQNYICSGSSFAGNLFRMISLGWQIILLMYAAVLAIQTRSIRQEFNESQRLAVMIYSQFIFFLLRIITVYALHLPPAESSSAISLLLSIDSFVTLLLYFGPKFLQAMKKEDLKSSGTSFSNSQYVTGVSGIDLGAARRNQEQYYLRSTMNASFSEPAVVSSTVSGGHSNNNKSLLPPGHNSMYHDTKPLDFNNSNNTSYNKSHYPNDFIHNRNQQEEGDPSNSSYDGTSSDNHNGNYLGNVKRFSHVSERGEEKEDKDALSSSSSSSSITPSVLSLEENVTSLLSSIQGKQNTNNDTNTRNTLPTATTLAKTDNRLIPNSHQEQTQGLLPKAPTATATATATNTNSNVATTAFIVLEAQNDNSEEFYFL